MKASIRGTDFMNMISFGSHQIYCFLYLNLTIPIMYNIVYEPTEAFRSTRSIFIGYVREISRTERIKFVMELMINTSCGIRYRSNCYA